MTPDKTSRIVITKMPKTVREMNSCMLRHILSDTHAVRATLALQSNLFMQNRHLIVLIALHSNCHDCKKKKMKQFSWLRSMDLMKLFYIRLSKGGDLKQREPLNKLRLPDWQHSSAIMEHYLPVLNTVMHSFQ